MSQAVPREQVEAALESGIAGLRRLVEYLEYNDQVSRAFHSMITEYQRAVIAEGLKWKHWPALTDIVRTYGGRCREAGLTPIGFSP